MLFPNKNTDFFKINKIATAFLLLNFIGIILTLLYNDTVIIDMWEHLRASYLVSSGNIPYKDFFEHHHPALWYIFAPIISILPPNAVMIFYISRIISLICSLGTLYFIYLIIKCFLGGKKLFLPFILILCSFFPVWYVISAFKPETFAYPLYFAGIYFCFDYIQNSNLKSLIYCGILYVFAFLLIQTMIFNIALIGIIISILCYRKRKFWRDMFLASAIPLTILTGLALLLYKNDMLELYFQTNWLYNLKIKFGENLTIWYWLLQIILGLYAFVWCFIKKKSVYLKIIGILFISEIVMVFVFYKTSPHYLYPAFIYMSVLIANLAEDIKSRTLQHYVYAFLSMCLILNFLTIFIKNNQAKISEFEIINQSTDNTVLNINSQVMNIYGKSFSYYELFPINMSSIDICAFNKYPDYSLKNDISENKYTYLVFNTEKKLSLPACMIDHFTITTDTLKYYQKITPNLWIIKKEI